MLQASEEGVGTDNFIVEDCSKYCNDVQIKDWSNEDLIQSIRDRFVTGDWSKAAVRGSATNDADGSEEDDDGSNYGDFEDLESGEVFNNQEDKNGESQNDVDPAAQARLMKKLALRAKFDSKYPFQFLHYSKHGCQY